jgi:adenylate cyclase
MERDEDGTFARVRALQHEVIEPRLAEHRGRLIKTTGDGFLAEFASPLAALKCALAIQDRPANDGGGTQLRLRIGLNLGDVIIEDSGDVYGEGVNVAARLEALADPGGILVSDKIFREVEGKLEATFDDCGEQQMKNISRPLRVYAVRLAGSAAASLAAASLPGASKPLPEKPSIAVLAFQNMSGDAEQEYFSDGISEDIITDLSKISGLMVIARNSSFTYKGKAVDIRAVGRELGVRCVLEGSVRRAGNRVRITAQLIDARDGSHLWAERFDRDLSDLFAVQDDVTSQIVSALKVTLKPAERTRIAGGGTSDVKAYDYFLRGREFLMGETKTREIFEQALKFLNLALEHDPHYSLAYVNLAWAHVFDFQNQWSGDAANALQLAKHNTARALEHDWNEPLAHVVASMVAAFDADLDKSKAEAEIALTLNPNCTVAYACLGNCSTFAGRPLEAIPMIERAMALDPAYTQQYLHLLGVAYLLAGRFETAANLLRQRILLVPNTDFSRAVLASALGHLGEIDEARGIWGELKQINPQYSFSAHFGRQPYKNKDDVRRIAEGLAKAGLSS